MRCAGGFPPRSTDGRLEARAGIALSPENSHAMLCGNPAMVEDTQKLLADARDAPAPAKGAGACHGRDLLVIFRHRGARLCWHGERVSSR